MKRTLLFLFATMLVLFVLVSCELPTEMPPALNITFAGEGDNMPQPLKIEEGYEYEVPADPTRVGYIFEGWVTVDGKPFSFDDLTFYEGTLVLRAQWKAITFVVTYYDYDGNVYNTVELEYGACAKDLKGPTAPEGYHFTTWNHANGEKHDMSTPLFEDVGLYATKAINEYTVRFVGANGEELSSVKVPHGETVVKPEDPAAPTGSTFEYWTVNGAEYDFAGAVTSDLDVVAYYSMDDCTVTFLGKDGATIETVTVPYGERVTALPTAPVVEHHTFDHWKTAEGEVFTLDTVVTFNMNVTASYNKNSYTVTFVDKDGATLATETVVYGDTIANAPVAPDVVGMTFAGWATEDGAAFSLDTAIDGNLTLKATYVDKVYTVRFLDEEGKEFANAKVTHGNTVAQPAIPEGKTAVSFTVNGADYDFAAAVTSDIDIVVAMTVAEYTVTYQVNGATVATVTVKHGENAALPAHPSDNYYAIDDMKKIANITSDTTIALTLVPKTNYESTSIGSADFDMTISDMAEGSRNQKFIVSVGQHFAHKANMAGKATMYMGFSSGFTPNMVFEIYLDDVLVNTLVVDKSGTKTLYDRIPAGEHTLKLVLVSSTSDGSAAQGANCTSFGYTVDMSNVTYTITFTKEDGTVISTVTVSHKGKATAPDMPATENGKNFDGFYASNGTAFDPDALVVADATYIAKYISPEFYTVTFIMPDGTENKQTVEKGENAKLPTHEDYYYDVEDFTALLNIQEDKTITLTTVPKSAYVGEWNGGFGLVTPTDEAIAKYNVTITGTKRGTWGRTFNTPGMYIEFTADCAGVVRTYVNIDSAGRSFVLDVYVDGVLANVVNLSTTNGSTLRDKIAMCEVDPGVHTIKIVVRDVQGTGGNGLNMTQVYMGPKVETAE